MKNIVLVVLISVFFHSCALAGKSDSAHSVRLINIESFAAVAAIVEQKTSQYSASDVLIVVDIDNTLLTSSSDLGGDVWYQWQRGELPVKPSNEQLVACLFEDSISLLYELAPMQLTESSVPEFIHNWQQKGITLFALTSRAPKNRAATERELNRAGLDFSHSALAEKGQPAPVWRDNLQREMSYMRGIMMTSGMNKGTMLRYLLKRTKRQFSAILFVDDSQKNVDNLSAEFSQDSDIDMTILHYTFVEQQRINQYGSVLTQQQADSMASQWQQLNATLNSIFPARAGETCLSR